MTGSKHERIRDTFDARITNRETIELDAVAGNRDEEEKEKWNGRKKTENGTSIGTKAKIRVQRIAFPPQLFTHADRMCTKEERQRAKTSEKEKMRKGSIG